MKIRNNQIKCLVCNFRKQSGQIDLVTQNTFYPASLHYHPYIYPSFLSSSCPIFVIYRLLYNPKQMGFFTPTPSPPPVSDTLNCIFRQCLCMCVWQRQWGVEKGREKDGRRWGRFQTWSTQMHEAGPHR